MALAASRGVTDLISFMIKHRTRADDMLCKTQYNNHIVCLVHKNHIIRTCLMYHEACKIEFQPFKQVVLIADVFQYRVYFSNFELVFVSRNPPDSSKEICYGDLVTEILLRRSCYGDSVTETPTHFNPYRFRQTLSTTHRRLIPCKGYLNTHQT